MVSFLSFQDGGGVDDGEGSGGGGAVVFLVEGEEIAGDRVVAQFVGFYGVGGIGVKDIVLIRKLKVSLIDSIQKLMLVGRSKLMHMLLMVLETLVKV